MASKNIVPDLENDLSPEEEAAIYQKNQTYKAEQTAKNKAAADAAAAKAAGRDPAIAALIKQLGKDNEATRAISAALYDKYGLASLADLGRSDPRTVHHEGGYAPDGSIAGDSGSGVSWVDPYDSQVQDWINKKTGEVIGRDGYLDLGYLDKDKVGTTYFNLDPTGQMGTRFQKRSHGIWDTGIMDFANMIPGINAYTIPVSAARAALNGNIGQAIAMMAPMGLDYLVNNTSLLSNMAGADFNPIASTPSGMIAEAAGLGLQGLPADMLGGAVTGAAKAGLTGGDVGTGAIVGGAGPLIGQGIRSITSGAKDLATSAADVLKGDAGNDLLMDSTDALTGGAGADQLAGTSISRIKPEGAAEEAEWYRQVATLPENQQRALLGGLTAQEALIYRTYAIDAGAGDLRPSDLGIGLPEMDRAFLTDDEYVWDGRNPLLSNDNSDDSFYRSQFGNGNSGGSAQVTTAPVYRADIHTDDLGPGSNYDPITGERVDPNLTSALTDALVDPFVDSGLPANQDTITGGDTLTDDYRSEGHAYTGENALDPTTSSPINATGGTSNLVDTTSGTKANDTSSGGNASNVVNNIITGAVTGAITNALTNDNKKTTTTNTATVSAVDSHVGGTAADTIDHRHWRQTGAKGTRGKGGVRYFDYFNTPQSAVDPKNPYNFTAPEEGTITTQALQSYYNPELNQYYTAPNGGYTPPDSKWQAVDSTFVDPYGGKPPSAQDTTTAHKEGGTVKTKHFDGGDYIPGIMDFDTGIDVEANNNYLSGLNYSDTGEEIQDWQNVNRPWGNTSAQDLAYEGDFGPSGTANNAMMAFSGSNPTEKILNALQKAGVNIGKTMLSSIEKNPMAWLSAIGGAIAGYKGRAKPITPVGLQSLGRSQDEIYARLRGGTYTRKAEGGEIHGYGSGGGLHYLKSAEDGMADRIPATIDGRQPARLSGGEFVIPADVVSHLGNGNSEAGADHLYTMMDKVRHARTGTKEQGKQIDPDKYTA